VASCSSTSTHSSTGTPKLKLKITKEDKKLTIQVLEQDERFSSNAALGSPKFVARNGFTVGSWSYPEIQERNRTLCLRGYSVDRDQRADTDEFGSNADRDTFLRDMEEALRDWAENAPEFKTTPDSTEGRIVTFKSDKAEVEFAKFTNGLAMKVLSMDERFRCLMRLEALAFTASCGLSVASFMNPLLGDVVIKLWGTDSYQDDMIATRTFASDAERDVYLAKALAALDDWSKNYEAWKTPEPCGCRCHTCSCADRCCPCAHPCCTKPEKDEYIFTV